MRIYNAISYNILRISLCNCVNLDLAWFWVFTPSSPSSTPNYSDDESLSEEELDKLKEWVEEKKKLISIIRNKPWCMAKRLTVLRYNILLIIVHMTSKSIGIRLCCHSIPPSTNIIFCGCWLNFLSILVLVKRFCPMVGLKERFVFYLCN